MHKPVEIPQEINEHIQRYCAERCPALARQLIEKLVAPSQSAVSDTERCDIGSLLRHWHAIDQSRVDTQVNQGGMEAMIESKRWRRLSVSKIDRDLCLVTDEA
jgi:hypothetical protein